MKNFLCVLGFLTITSFLLYACTMSANSTLWESPVRFNKAEIFNAALQAGGQIGMKTTSSDQQSGTMSFSQRSGKGDLILNVQVVDSKGTVQVRTTSEIVGGIPFEGLQKQAIGKFHKSFYRILDITDKSERYVKIVPTS